MTLPGYLRPDLLPFHWHWLMFDLLNFLGPELVWEVGLNALGYPPTWVDTSEEFEKVESAIAEFLKGKY